MSAEIEVEFTPTGDPLTPTEMAALAVVLRGAPE